MVRGERGLTKYVDTHRPIEDDRDVLLGERVRQEGHHPGDPQQQGQEDGVPHGVDNPPLGAHIPDNNKIQVLIFINLSSPSLPGLVSCTDCLDGDGQVENKDQAWRGDTAGQCPS